jgi:hypothetical protein
MLKSIISIIGASRRSQHIQQAAKPGQPNFQNNFVTSSTYRRIEGLRTSNPHDWWRHTKQLLGQQVKPQLQSLINDAAGGDVQLLADLINNALQQVSKDLLPLYDVSVHQKSLLYQTNTLFRPDEKFPVLSRVKTYKSPGPDDIPTGF